jgi:peptidoglycan-associated lipoprotein
MRQRQSFLRISFLLIIAISLVAIVGCNKKVETEPEAPAPVEKTTPPPAPPVTKQVDDFKSEPPKEAEPTRSQLIDEWNREGVLATIYFAYDSAELSETARRTLSSNATWLKNNGDANLIIEGHCDERGTIEYNLALGERRASSVRDYLNTLGVSRSRVRVITYGEERPVDAGHSESAWSKNRRAAFVLE